MSRLRSAGYSVVELLVALTIGLVLMLGVMAVFVTSRSTYQASEVQARMVDDGRFVMELLSKDLRLAGSWGRNSATNMISNRPGPGGNASQAPQLATLPASDDCEADWYADVGMRVLATNGGSTTDDPNPYAATCTTNWLQDTDMLVVRYADPQPILDADLATNAIYLHSGLMNSVLFKASGDPSTVPTQPGGPDVTNHRLQTHLYYVADFSETPGDGVPSLRRVSLGPGPAVDDEMLISGVENFQVQLGIDTDTPEDGQANIYVDADNDLIDWAQTDGAGGVDWDALNSRERIRSVRVWVLLRSELPQATVTSAGTYAMGGETINGEAPPAGSNGNYKRLMVSGVYDIRNYPVGTFTP